MHQHWPSPNQSDSFIQRRPAAAKVLLALAVIGAVVGIPARNAIYLLIPTIVLLAIAIASRISVKHLLIRLTMLEPFALGVALLSLFQPGGWRVTLLILAKCTLCFMTMILLSFTTSVSELVGVLRRIHMPSLLVTTMLLMHRYLFVLIDETQRMKRARASRTFQKSRRLQWRTLSTVIGQLFIRSVDRADRVYAAMCARGWQ